MVSYVFLPNILKSSYNLKVIQVIIKEFKAVVKDGVLNDKLNADET